MLHTVKPTSGRSKWRNSGYLSVSVEGWLEGAVKDRRGAPQGPQETDLLASSRSAEEEKGRS